MPTPCVNSYKELACAVLTQAVNDWTENRKLSIVFCKPKASSNPRIIYLIRRALKYKKLKDIRANREYYYKIARNTVIHDREELLTFFSSGWCEELFVLADVGYEKAVREMEIDLYL